MLTHGASAAIFYATSIDSAHASRWWTFRLFRTIPLLAILLAAMGDKSVRGENQAQRALLHTPAGSHPPQVNATDREALMDIPLALRIVVVIGKRIPSSLLECLIPAEITSKGKALLPSPSHGQKQAKPLRRLPLPSQVIQLHQLSNDFICLATGNCLRNAGLQVIFQDNGFQFFDGHPNRIRLAQDIHTVFIFIYHFANAPEMAFDVA
jgi:hypothetical protein